MDKKTSKRNHIKKKENHRIHFIQCALLLLISIFLFFSFFSFLYHWKCDQSQLDGILDYEIIVENIMGKIGAYLSHVFIHCGIGISAFFIPILLFLTGGKILFHKEKWMNNLFYKSIIYTFIFFSIWTPLASYLLFPKKGILMGIFGFEWGGILKNFFGKLGLSLLMITSIILYFILIWHLHSHVKKKIKIIEKQIHNQFRFSFSKNKHSHEFKKNKGNKQQIKNIHVLFTKDQNSWINHVHDMQIHLESNKKKIGQILNYYNISISQIHAIAGPNVTVYEIHPNIKTRISKIKNLEQEIALRLSVPSIRILAPIPGKGTIGLEIPNSKRYPLHIKDIFISEEIEKKSQNMELPISLGKTVFNELFMIDLYEMPHLLIAGSTGQGKSIGLHVILTFLLSQKTPEEIKLILIDPKKVEMSVYRNISPSYFAQIPNTINPIITNSHETEKVLHSVCKEMDQRFALLEKYRVRNIQEYNKIPFHHHTPTNLPYIIMVIDEFSDLICSLKTKNIERYITRLAQLSRAVGIHLILSTQRPSVDVITGIIKSNFTARIAFKVSSQIDSRTILDCSGAEKLLGKGDLLFSNKNELIRVQCPLINLEDIQKIVHHYGNIYAKKKKYLLPKPDVCAMDSSIRFNQG
ncbi:DNA translocase FtsK 4TM domain-containing protein [Blattabacterium cuenoti]|uniref:DNA translocase FtsK 4TM domain-containing protein n=1 Tax=Blattabacterium cuenoti TaxID=1653831 RepID=UPI00163BFA3A|nr:DNA translocase FtsK 4TM domain-containing protein [Blattabacterium cuenoti]